MVVAARQLRPGAGTASFADDSLDDDLARLTAARPV
jgi:hypothetical protein